jgi:tRNA 2-thiocytidine biosynthesis protein TtcA
MKTNIVRRKAGKAIADFDMIRQGDQVMVALSGGKDSYCLLHVLVDLQRRAPVEFSLLPVIVDAGFPGFDLEPVIAFVSERGLELHVEKTDIYKSVIRIKNAGTRSCSLCSRFRRGVLYRLGEEMECSSIALGHHADDLIETLAMNLFFNGTLKSMAPIWQAEDGYNTVIRPLCYVWEREIEAYQADFHLPQSDFSCPLGGESEDMKRQRVKKFLRQWNDMFPGLKQNILSALSRLKPEYLMDKDFWDQTQAR